MKASLKKLEQDDPELAAFMKETDSSIFDFDESSDSENENGDEMEASSGGSDESDIESSEEEVDESKKGIHKLPKKLKTASDSDEDDDADDDAGVKSDSKKKRLVTVKMVRHWGQLMRERNSLPALQDLIAAFKAAVHQSNEDKSVTLKFRVEGTAVFNAVVSTCVVEIASFLTRLLKVPKSKDPNKIVLPSTSNKWKRVKVEVKSYVTDLLQLLSQMASPDVVTVLLKHVHQMITYFACFPKLPKLLLKKLIVLWSTTEETCRLLAFMCIMRLVLLLTDTLLEYSLKHMYKTYVSNCKFTSVTTLHLITFMQRCLVEMLGIRLDLSYHFAFIYIRQLAIHLRNAITAQKKDLCKTVYNWQYVHSLVLWTRLVCEHHGDDSIHSLIYPLVQVITGTVKLIPSAQYFPLRFHCVRALNMISDSTGVFIPVLPFLIEVLESPEVRRKPKAAGAKAFTFACILKLSKPQIHDKAFQDGVIDQLYELFLEYMTVHSHSLGFPELILPAVLQIKKFIKLCRTPAHVKKLKQLADKVEESSKVTVQRRRTLTINLADFKAVKDWESKNKEQGNPLSIFVSNWRKVRERQLLPVVKHDQMLGSDLPTIERRKGPKIASEEERQEFNDIFNSSSDESDDESRFLLKEERPSVKKNEKKTAESSGKKRKLEPNETSESEYSDLDDDDLEMLNRSASEDDEEEDDNEMLSDDDNKGDDQNKQQKEDDSDNEVDETEDIVEDFKLSDSDNDE